MLSFDDPRWAGLQGGYRVPYDPRPTLSALEDPQTVDGAWHDLWDQLHHQGDVGLASYAAVPHIVRFYRKRPTADWNAYAIVAVIDSARRGRIRPNPPLPSWLADSYSAAIRDLSDIGLTELPDATDPSLCRAILAILAIDKGLGLLGEVAISCTDDELLEYLKFGLG
jgi:hypothetical protein